MIPISVGLICFMFYVYFYEKTHHVSISYRENTKHETIVKTDSNGLCVPYRNLKIDKLLPELHFRPSWKDGVKPFGPDRELLKPYLLGVHVDFTKYERTVLLDLGAKTYHSSVSWFLHHYPGSFAEIHAFERVKGQFGEIPPQHKKLLENTNLTLYEKYVSTKDSDDEIDLVRFMKYTLNLRTSDMVIVKMDIEDAEWAVIGKMEKEGVMGLVDELFVEVHYHHPVMDRFGWKNFSHTLEDATRLLRHLRDDLGIYAHAWP